MDEESSNLCHKYMELLLDECMWLVVVPQPYIKRQDVRETGLCKILLRIYAGLSSNKFSYRLVFEHQFVVMTL